MSRATFQNLNLRLHLKSIFNSDVQNRARPTLWPNFSVKWTFAVIIQVGFSYCILNRDQNLNLNPNLNLKFKQILC